VFWGFTCGGPRDGYVAGASVTNISVGAPPNVSWVASPNISPGAPPNVSGLPPA
jgi:hypothetical protein